VEAEVDSQTLKLNSSLKLSLHFFINSKSHLHTQSIFAKTLLSSNDLAIHGDKGSVQLLYKLTSWIYNWLKLIALVSETRCGRTMI